MKLFNNMKWHLALAMWVLGTALCAAQDSFFEKYEAMDGVTMVSVSPKIFQLLSGSGNLKFNGIDINQLDISGFKVLSTERSEICAQMKADFAQWVSRSAYEELMRVKDDESNVVFYVQQKGDIIKNMVMIASEPDECTVMRLSGNFTLQDIRSVAESVSVGFVY